MATGSTGGGPSVYAQPPDAKAANPLLAKQAGAVPPGNALLAKEQTAGQREQAGLNPSVSPLDAAKNLLHLLTAHRSSITLQGKQYPVQPDTVFTPATALTLLPQQIGSAHRQAVELAHPSAANPPSLHREIDALISGALGVPRMGVDEPKPHPLLAGKPTIQKGPAPTVPTLGEAVTGGLQGARGIRGEQEILRSQERAARSQAYGKALQANPTMAGAKEASKLLAGEYPKVRFAGFQDFTPEAQDAMVKVIADHPTLQGFERKRATAAISAVVDGKVPTKSQEKLLRTVFGPDTTGDLMRSVSRFQQLKALGYDAANIPRSVMASYDASGILRQALMVGTGHPKIWAKNVPGYIKAMKSEDVYNAGMQLLHQRPNALNGVYEKMGVDLTELTPRGQAAAREEAFRSPLAEKIPGVRMSGRGFTLFLDNARADLADHMYAKAIRLGRDPNDPHLLESIGDVVNSSSGRGDLGTGVIGRSQEGLNLLLFSPRLIKSRIDFLNPVWYAKLDPLARHEAYKAMGGLVVLVATALGISRAAGTKVNLDPRSSDFAKIKAGNTRIDLGGGFQQYIRLLSEIASQQVVSSTTGKTTNLGQEGPGKTSDWDVLFRFLRSKLAPLSSASVDVSQRQNGVGQPLTWQNSVLSRVTPLSGQDAVQVGQDATHQTGSLPAGILAGLGAFGLSAIGGGVQNYTPKQPKTRTGRSTGSPYAQPASSGGSPYAGGGSTGGSPYSAGR